jgi:hypothetical protein
MDFEKTSLAPAPSLLGVEQRLELASRLYRESRQAPRLAIFVVQQLVGLVAVGE